MNGLKIPLEMSRFLSAGGMGLLVPLLQDEGGGPIWRSFWFNLVVVALAVVFLGLWLITLRRYRCVNQQHQRGLDDFCQKHRLSDREKAILCLIVEGKSNTEIGKKVFISSHTVRNHVHNIYQKVNVKNRVELVNRVRDHLALDSPVS